MEIHDAFPQTPLNGINNALVAPFDMTFHFWESLNLLNGPIQTMMFLAMRNVPPSIGTTYPFEIHS